jgi:hypothetical protein
MPPSGTRSGLRSGAAGVGFVIGLLVPTTRLEDEKLGPASDKVGRGRTARAGSTANRSRRRAPRARCRRAKESASRHGEELSSSLQDRLPSEQSGSEQQRQPQGQQQPS